MDYILVKFEDNYADEFDVNGFCVFTNDEYEAWLSRVKKEFAYSSAKREKARANWKPKYEYDRFYDGDFVVEYGFGSNEQLQWTFQEDFLGSLSISLISETEKDFLAKQFGESVLNYGWGIFPDFDNDFEE